MRRLVLVVALVAACPWAAFADEAAFGVAVRRRTATHVYLAAGVRDGLEVGQQYGVYRGAALVGRVEVIFTAEHSATARIAAESMAIAPNDCLGAVSPVRVEFETVAVGDASDSIPGRGAVGVQPPPSKANVQGPAPQATAPDAGNVVADRRPTRVRGTVRVGWERFDPSFEDEPATGNLTGRFNLGVQDLGGPWNVDLRMRLRQVDHGEPRADWYDAKESRHRLDQLALAYLPTTGRFSARLGRIGVSPFAGVGYLDGLMLEARVTDVVGVGAFAGAVPQVNGIDVDFGQAKYGAYARFHVTPGTEHDLQLITAGVREAFNNGENRDYIVAEVDWAAGSRFTFMQRVELDLARPDGLDAASSPLANFSLMSSYRISNRSRVSFSYVRANWLPYDAEAFDLPWIVNPAATERLQVMLGVPLPAAVGLTLRGGLRSRDDVEGATYFGGAMLNRSWRNGFWLSGNADLQSGDDYRGHGYGLQAGKRWRGGFSLAAGYHRLVNEVRATARTSDMRWGELSFAYDIGRRVFIEGAGELSSGDLLDGRRLYFGTGYRF